MKSATLTVPATVARALRVGLHDEIGFAADEISDACKLVGERPRSVYEDAFMALHCASALLDSIGYETPEPPVAFEVTPGEHRWMLLKALRGQRQATLEWLDEISEADRPAALQCAAVLERLIVAADWES
jgi:hypothetical protein